MQSGKSWEEELSHVNEVINLFLERENKHSKSEEKVDE